MKIQRTFLIAAAVLVVTALTACVGVDGRPLAESLAIDVGPASASQPAPSPSPLPIIHETEIAVVLPVVVQVLDYAPTDTSLLLFTDWSMIKDRLGIADLSSDTDDDIAAFIKALGHEAVATMYASGRFPIHKASWGWDTLDLEWEVMVQSDEGAPVYILRFRNSETLDTVRDQFKAREFKGETYRGVDLYTHQLDPSADWIRSTELAILNAAVFGPQRLLVLSANPGSLGAYVHAMTSGKTLADDDTTRATVYRMGPASTGIVEIGPEACLSFGLNPFVNVLGKSDISAEAIQKELDRVMPARPLSLYTALAIGLVNDEREPDRLVWKVVMRYPSSKLAEMDLASRRMIAEQGMSITRKMANRDLFTVEDARVQGRDGVFWLAPANGITRLLVQQFLLRDLAFLACP